MWCLSLTLPHHAAATAPQLQPPSTNVLLRAGLQRAVAQDCVQSGCISKGETLLLLCYCSGSGQPLPLSDHALSEIVLIFKYNFLHFSLCLLTESASEPSPFQANNPSPLHLSSNTKHSNPLILTLPLTHSSLSTSQVHWEASAGHSTSNSSHQC